MPNNAIDIDERLWPLVRFTMRNGASQGDWLALFDAYDRFYQRGERFAIINDSTLLTTVPSAATRKLIADMAKQHEPMSERWVACSCVILTNPIVRGALTALTWISKPVYPLRYVESMSEAVSIAVEALKSEGVTIDVRLTEQP